MSSDLWGRVEWSEKTGEGQKPKLQGGPRLRFAGGAHVQVAWKWAPGLGLGIETVLQHINQ